MHARAPDHSSREEQTPLSAQPQVRPCPVTARAGEAAPGPAARRLGAVRGGFRGGGAPRGGACMNSLSDALVKMLKATHHLQNLVT